MTVQPASKVADIVDSFVPFYDRTRAMTLFEYKKYQKEIAAIDDFADRYMLLGMLECHYGDAEACRDNFSKALYLCQEDTYCHNYIVALQWLGDFRGAYQACEDYLGKIFAKSSLENILSFAHSYFIVDLVDKCLCRAETLSLGEFENAYERMLYSFNAFKATEYYCKDDELGYSELLMDFATEFSLFEVTGIHVNYDEEDKVLHLLIMVNDGYDDNGETFVKSQEYFIDNVFKRELNQRIVVSYLTGASVGGEEDVRKF